MNDFDRKYMLALLRLHDEHMRLDSRDDAEVRLWHMLRSMLEFCKEQNINLERVLQDAKEDMAVAS